MISEKVKSKVPPGRNKKSFLENLSGVFIGK
jgi:hypothetical protein